MELIVDGERIEPGQADAIAERLSRSGRVPWRLSVDGCERSVAELGGLAPGALRIELETHSLAEAAKRAFDTARDYLPKLGQGLQRSSARLGRGEVGPAMEDLAEVCQGLAWFFDLMAGLRPLLGEDSRDWAPEAASFQKLLVDTERAMDQQDWVLVEDLLRYEWDPRLHAWASDLGEEEACCLHALSQQAGGRP